MVNVACGVEMRWFALDEQIVICHVAANRKFVNPFSDIKPKFDILFLIIYNIQLWICLVKNTS